MNLALFDFDGTITTCDTFTPFIKTAISSPRLYIGGFILIPYLILYKLGLISPSLMRKKVVYVGLKRLRISNIETIGRDFCYNFIVNKTRKEAMEKIKKHLTDGDRVIVVSASLDVYLRPWCELIGVELICTSLEVNSRGVLTGRYLGGDCAGIEKLNRIKKIVNLSGYEKIYAYGDTKEDLEMLTLAHERYYQWRKVK